MSLKTVVARTLAAALGAAWIGAAAASPFSVAVSQQPAGPPKVVALNQAAIDLAPGVNAQAFAAQHGLQLHRPMKVGHNAWIMKGPSAQFVARVVKQLEGAHGVEGVFQDRLFPIKQCSFVPNDPLYPYWEGGAWLGQWHLTGRLQPGVTKPHLSISEPWANDFLGAGVLLGIVDGLVNVSHPDLAPNANLAASVDLGGFAGGPQHHATAMAGLAAARGGNGLGVTGVAPAASFASIALDTDFVAESAFIEAVKRGAGAFHAKVYGFNFSAPFTFSPGLEHFILTQSTARTGATAHIFPAGNDRFNFSDGVALGDTAVHPHLNTPGAIVVAGSVAGPVNDEYRYGSYSSYGGAVTVTAPGGDENLGLVTTGTTGLVGLPDFGTYTTQFTGTSGAAANVAGVYALLKSQRPDLDPRMFKHLLAKTSERRDENDVSVEGDGGWRTNAAGIAFNPNYGFGQLNASNLSREIDRYAYVGFRGTHKVGSGGNYEITESDWKTISFRVGSGSKIEEFVLSSFGDLSTTQIHRLEIRVISPNGTETRLKRGIDSQASPNMFRQQIRFMTNAFWGETAGGTWQVKLRLMGGSNITAFLENSYIQLHYGQLSSKALATPSDVEVSQPGVHQLPILLDRQPASPGTIVSFSTDRPDLISFPNRQVNLTDSVNAVDFRMTQPVSEPTVVTVTVTSTEGVRTAEILVTPPGMLQSINFSPEGTMVGGRSVDIVVGLNGPVSEERIVSLVSSHPAIVVPAQVVVPPNESYSRISVQTAGVPANTEVRVTATLGPRSFTDRIVLTPPVLEGVSISPSQVTGGVNTTGTVTIEGTAGPSGVVVNLRSNRSQVTVPASVTIPAGTSSVNFPVATASVSTFTEATIVASHGFRTRNAVVRLVAAAISNHTVSPATVVGGATATGAVSLDVPAPAGGVVVTLSSNRPQVVVPASVTIPQGATTATYTAATTSSGALVQATLYASYQGRTRWAVLTVNPVGVDSLTLSPASLVGGSSSTGTVTLNGPAPAGGLTIALSSNRAQATVPSTVVIPEGATTGTFTVNTTASPSQVQATIYASLNGRTRWAVLTIRR